MRLQESGMNDGKTRINNQFMYTILVLNQYQTDINSIYHHEVEKGEKILLYLFLSKTDSLEHLN